MYSITKLPPEKLFLWMESRVGVGDSRVEIITKGMMSWSRAQGHHSRPPPCAKHMSFLGQTYFCIYELRKSQSVLSSLSFLFAGNLRVKGRCSSQIQTFVLILAQYPPLVLLYIHLDFITHFLTFCTMCMSAPIFIRKRTGI